MALAARTPLYAGPRLPVPVELVPREKSDADVVILIVDESMTADFLGINGFDRPTTPYLASTASQYVNLGTASSGGNKSATSNMILRSGLRVDQVPDGAQLSLRCPNIFQYARKAGYWTAYIDAQSSAHKFSNYMRLELVELQREILIHESTIRDGDFSSVLSEMNRSGRQKIIKDITEFNNTSINCLQSTSIVRSCFVIPLPIFFYLK